MKWYLHACPVCGGDLHDDLEDRGWVTCFMCARSFAAADLDLTPAVGADQRGLAQAVELNEAA